MFLTRVSHVDGDLERLTRASPEALNMQRDQLEMLQELQKSLIPTPIALAEASQGRPLKGDGWFESNHWYSDVNAPTEVSPSTGQIRGMI